MLVDLQALLAFVSGNQLDLSVGEAFELINVLPLDRMKQALEDPRYRWRSVERLSHIAGVPEADALKILRDDAAIVLGMGKSGREIARLKSR